MGVTPSEPIVATEVERHLGAWTDQALYLHLETTAGAYTEAGYGAFARNLPIRFTQAAVRGEGPFRVGLRLDGGWVYAEGLTEWGVEAGRLLFAGRDAEERLTVALELSHAPFAV